MSEWTLEQLGDQSGKNVIVTGANSGLGFATVKALAGAGAHVVLACRSEERGQAALARIREAHPEAAIELVRLDLGYLESVRSFASAIGERLTELHALVNNAGIMFPPHGQTTDGFETQLGINHLGHFALTAQLWELLVRTPGARVVNVSSVGHRLNGLDLDDPHYERRRYSKLFSYGQSKLANLLFTFELQRRIDRAGLAVKAVAAHPGWTHTGLQDGTMFAPFNPLFAMAPEQGSLPQLFAAVAPEAQGGGYYGPSGLFELRGYPAEAKSSRASRDEETAARLWELSEQMTGVAFAVAPARRAGEPLATPRASA